MTSLDINTPKGQITLQQELEAISMFEYRYPSSKYMHTPKSSIAAIDGLIIKSGCLDAVVETKCRDMSLKIFEERFNSQWLVTFDKIVKGAEVADLLQVPLWGFLFLLQDKILLIKKIYHPKDGWGASFSVEKTRTQATCNGGIANRDNAYIDMSGAAKII